MIGINERNCNYFLTMLYNDRDQISSDIDRAIVSGKNDLASKLEDDYYEICEKITKFLRFRETHDCLLEGDPGYGPA